MIKTASRALLAVLVLMLLTGVVYPLAMTAVAQVAFGDKADGSLVLQDGAPVGSRWIGQAWAGPGWFYGRPSAIAEPYDAATSGGSNLGPNSQALADVLTERAGVIRDIEGPWHPGLTTSRIPADLLTASGSGLDPDISVEAAGFQAPRIAEERGLPLAEVQALIEAQTAGPDLGILGESRVNVLELNAALASLDQQTR